MTPTEESLVQVGDIELCWQRFGDEEAPALLMIMGLGSQMILWPDGFCEALADRGFGVIRFDNRDAGRSTIVADGGTPSISAALAGDLAAAPYSLSDMAADSVGLLDALGLEHAHVVGASLGGMVAQTLAIEYPHRVLSLASIMSTTGDPEVGKPTVAGMQALTTTPPPDREGYLEAIVRARGLIASPGFPRDEEYARDVAERTFDRGYHPDGTLRQIVAIIASGNRTPRLRELTLPTVVIHGEDDPLIGVSGGRATAGAIADARLVLIPGMGHDLPTQVWDRIADAIAENATRAGFPDALAELVHEEDE
jgi:pimeloyl-ACP methyl ester carboxylesterase